MEEFSVKKEGYYRAANGRKVYMHFTSDVLSYGVIPGDAVQYIYKKDGSLFKYRSPGDTTWICKIGSNNKIFNDLSIAEEWNNNDPFKLNLNFNQG